MSTGGNVPSQGTTAAALSDAKQQQLTQDKKRGPRGEVGEGTPGSRLKAEWRQTYEDLGPKEKRPSLKAWARGMLKVEHPDARPWFDSKGAGTPEQRAERRQKRKMQQLANRSAKDARRSKGKNKQSSKSEEKRR